MKTKVGDIVRVCYHAIKGEREAGLGTQREVLAVYPKFNVIYVSGPLCTDKGAFTKHWIREPKR